jgi:RNA polymerase sigma-70 factor (ECF subfamily)
VRPALINGAAGVVVAPRGRPVSIMAFTVRGGKIVAIDALADPTRLRQLDLTVLDDA